MSRIKRCTIFTVKMLKLMCEYARMLNVSASLLRLLESFASVVKFDQDSSDYEVYQVRKRGGAFGYGCKEYEVRNDLESFLLDCLVERHYESLYNQAVDVLRSHKIRIRFIVQFFEAIGHVDDRAVENFLRDKLFSLEKTFKNVYAKIVVLLLSNIQHEHFELLRAKLLGIVNTTCDDVERCVLAIRDEDSMSLEMNTTNSLFVDDVATSRVVEDINASRQQTIVRKRKRVAKRIKADENVELPA